MAERKSPVSSQASELNAFLNKGSSFDGKLSFQGTVRIDGQFKGDIVSSDTLIVGESGHVTGTISVGELICSGYATGEFLIARRMQLLPTARVDGNIRTAALAISEGAKLNGTCSMDAQVKDAKSAPVLAQPRKASEKHAEPPVGDVMAAALAKF